MSPRPQAPWLLYAALAVVVWGLFVPDQGLWHDDVQNLFRAFVAPGRGEGLFPVIATPTRRLLGLPFIVANASGWPVQALHLMSALAWLACGLLADRLARRLWPGASLAPWLAGALTLCATPDFFTDAPLAVGYQWSIVAYLGAVLAGLAWLQDGSRLAIVAAPLCLSAGLWTTDAALVAWALTPLLWAAAPGDRGRRAVVLTLVWYAAVVPYLVIVLRQLSIGGGYLEQALVPLGPVAWLARWGDLLLWNLTPWRWATARPSWFPRPGVVIPLPVRWVLAVAVGALGSVALFRAAHDQRLPARGVRAALASILLMASANATFVSVRLSEVFCRTHLLSRVFASLALAWLAGVAWSRARGPVDRGVVGALVGAWLALGVAGAFERQDYFVGYTRAHRQELGSVLDEVPGFAADASLVLRIPEHPGYLATEAGYLARAWTTLLYEDASVECRTFLWSANRPATCVAEPSGLRCRGERSPECPAQQAADGQLLPYDRLIVLEYQPASNRYRRLRELAAGAVGLGASYRPDEQIRPASRSRMARALLDHNRGLASRLWP